ncbi:MAG: hypothetical protein KBT31_02985 [Firmicutes bacterium]|nr:hypothetical protein [Candidatus Colimorpha enterica]
MKKLIALLLTVSTLLATSCVAVKTGDDGTTDTKKTPDEQTTAGEGTTAEEQTTADEQTTVDDVTTAEDVTTATRTTKQEPDIEVDFVAWPLEELMAMSDNILKARFIGKTVDENDVIYSFDVLEEYYGNTLRKTIDMFYGNKWGLRTDFPYEKGKDYFLLLSDRGDQYSGGQGKWVAADHWMFLPAYDVSKMILNDKPIKESSEIKKLRNEKDFIKYLKSVIAGEGFPEPKEKKYILSDDIGEIVSRSEVIFAVTARKIQYRSVSDINEKKDFFVCEVAEVYKGDIEVGTTVDVIFMKGTVSMGETVIFAGYMDEAKDLFRITSPSSVYKMTEKDNIIALIEEQK